jgi:hypothetical protein
MALTDYAGLKQEVIAFTGRDDLSDRFDAFLSLAEAKIYRTNSDRTLRVREMETSVALQTVGGVNSVTLPADWLELRSVKIETGGSEIELIYCSPSAINEFESGFPNLFTIKNGVLAFNYVPDGVYDLTVDYYAIPTALSSGNPTKTMLTTYPDIYLFACMSSVYDFTTEPELSQFNMQKAQASIKGAMKSNERAIRKVPTAKVAGSTP